MKKIFLRIVFSAVLGTGVIGPRLSLAEMTIRQEIEAIFQVKDINSPEAKFEEYREVPSGLAMEKYEMNAKSETTDIEVEIKDIRQDDQSATVELDKGRMNIKASWDQTPHLFSKETKTPLQEDSSGVLRAPDQLQRDVQFATATYVAAYSGNLRPVDLKTRTDVGSIELDYALGERLSGRLGVSETIKKGHQALGAAFTRSHIVQVAQPIDHKTYDSNLGLGYAGKTFQWDIGYGFSAFKNEIETITLDNPRRITDALSESSQGRLNTASDNVAHSGSMALGYNFSRKTRATADVNLTYMRQNQPLLPYTINTASNPTGGSNWAYRNRPADKADATVVNWVQDYRLVSQILKPLKGALRYHNFQQNNRTPEYTFDGSVGLDFNFSGTDTQNHAFEMKKEVIAATLDYEMLSSLNLGVGFDMNTIQRQHREVEDQEENIANFDLDYHPIKGLMVKGSFANARRRMDALHEEELVNVGETPGMRLFDVSDRDRNEGKIILQLTTAKNVWSVNGSLGHDKYKPGKGDLAALSKGGNAANRSTMYGLLETRNAGAGIDYDGTLSDRFSLFGYFDYQTDKGLQRSNYNSGGTVSQDAATDWEHEIQNRYQTAGLGFNTDVGTVILTMGADISVSKGNYNFVARGTDATLQALNNLPETKTTKQNYYAQAKMPVGPKVELGLGYVFEKYDVYDWASEAAPTVNTYGTTSEFYLSDSSKDYKAHIITAKANLKF